MVGYGGSAATAVEGEEEEEDGEEVDAKHNKGVPGPIVVAALGVTDGVCC